MPNYFEIPTI